MIQQYRWFHQGLALPSHGATTGKKNLDGDSNNDFSRPLANINDHTPRFYFLSMQNRASLSGVFHSLQHVRMEWRNIMSNLHNCLFGFTGRFRAMDSSPHSMTKRLEFNPVHKSDDVLAMEMVACDEEGQVEN